MKRFCTFLGILIALSCGLNIAFAQEVSIRRLENTPEVSSVGQVLKYRIDIDDAASLTKANLTWSAPDELIEIKSIGTTNLFTSDLSNRTFNADALAPGKVSYVAGWLTFRAISAGSGNLRVTGTLTTIQGTVNVDTQLPIIVRSPDPSHLLPAGGDFEFTRKVSADSPGWNSVGVPSMIELDLYNAVNIAEYEVELTYDVNALGVMTVNTSPGTTVVGASAGKITLRGSWTTPQSSDLFLATLLYTPIRGGDTTVKVTRGILKNSATDTPGTVAGGGFYVGIVDKVITNVEVIPGDGKLAVTWDPVPGADSYTVRGYGQPDLGRVEARVQTPTTNVTLTNLRNDGEYTVWVSADKDDRLFATARKGVKATPTLNQVPQTGDRPVHIPDPSLRAVIEEALGKSSGATITRADMLKLTELEKRDAGIRDLTGLEFATNLTTLKLYANDISDISPLAKLTELTTLILGRNTLTDISPVASLTNLTKLELAYTHITDISPVAGLTQLTLLLLYNNRITDISPVASLTNLTGLWLEGNHITDISPVAGLTQLTYLNLEYNAFRVSPVASLNISPVASLTNLNKLILGGNRITDISPLAGLTELTVLTLDENEITDISPLAKFTKLTSLWLGGNQITDISPLAGLTNLRKLRLNGNRILDFSPIAGLIPNLTDYDNSNQDVLQEEQPVIEDGGDDGPSDGDAAVVSIDPLQVVPTLGSQLTIPLKITNAQNVIAYQAAVNFDPSELRYVSSAYADYPSAGAFFIPPRISEGRVVFVATGTEVGAASGTLGTVTFAVVASKKPTIWLTDVELAGRDGELLAVIIKDGSPQGERRVLPSIDESSTKNQATAEEDPEDVQAAVDTDPPVVDPNTAINIPDPGLRSAIERGLRKRSTITRTDMLELTELNGSDSVIRDLTGLEFAMNLTDLTLWIGQIADISPLAKLTNLTTLTLVNADLTDISSLAGLTQLTQLWLYNNEISDISPLAGLTNLTLLNLASNKISDISPLAGLTNLTSLNLASNKISDFSPIAGLIPNLTDYDNSNQQGLDTPVNIPDPKLRLAIEKALGKAQDATITPADMLSLTNFTKAVQRGVQNLTGLEFATNLTNLDLRGNEISDVFPLAGLKNLTYLALYDNPLSDVSPLAGLKNLTELGLTKISDVSPLAGLKNLTELYLYDNEISDVSALAGLKNLMQLHISRSPLSDVSALAGLKNLTALNLSKNEISDVSALAGLKNLTHLHLQENKISDISPLAGLKNLTWLDISYNQISDFSPIDGLVPNLEVYYKDYQLTGGADPNAPVTIPDPNLRAAIQAAIEDRLGKAKGVPITVSKIYTLVHLWAEDRGIKDLTGLEFATNLRFLEISGNEISDVSPLAGLKNLGRLELQRNEISDVSPLVGLKNLKFLNLKDNLISNVLLLGLLPESTEVLVDSIPVEGCTSHMPDPNAQLMPPAPKVEKVPIRNKNGGNLGMYAETKGAPSLSKGGKTLNWTTGSTVSKADDDIRTDVIITVEFLNGQPKEKDMVEAAAREWERHGGFEFKFVESGASDIRVKFDYEYLHEHQVKTQIDNEGKPTIKYTSTGNIYTADEAKTYNKEGYTLILGDDDRYDEVKIRMKPDENGNPKFVYTWTGEVYTVDEAKAYNKEGYTLLAHSNWESAVGTGAKQSGLNDPTMQLTTNFSHGTLLHEFGHALGLTHEHLSPKFKEYFAWKDEKEVLAHYKWLNTGWTDTDVRDNVLTTRQIDMSTPLVDFDRHSVMTYEIPAKLITARSNAKWVQEAVKGNGIAKNYALSEGDKAIIKYLYPESLWASIEGSISVHGRDDDWPAGPDWFDNRDDPIEIAERHFDYEGRDLENYPNLDRIYVARWGGECRVEVYLCARNIDKDRGIEAGVFALLYEEDDENNTDLEDIVCETFYLPFGTEKTISLDKMKVRRGFNIAFTHSKCKELYTHDEFYLGDITDIFGGDTWAEVTLKLTAYDQTPIEITAESIEAFGAPSATATADTASADVNGDGQVNVGDLVRVSNYLGQTGSIDPRVDVNSDGIVTIADLVWVAQHLGSSMYASAPIGVVPIGLKYSTVVGWIDQARIEDDGSLVFQQGIARLEYLLTLIIPEETALLLNYPNPFNPETWIPYHLASSADVALTIYAIDGRVVRHLDLGHQAAGYYQSKSRAAYWDGRNNVGERVASGIYFYTLKAGDFSATKKMLIRK